MYSATTNGIVISVRPSYLADRSDPGDGRWLFAYTIEIANTSTDMVSLRSRYWQITDAVGHVEEVHGPGVVGEQPTLKPGDSFTYTSGCPLSTPSGIMRGHFNMQRADGSFFQAEVPAFSLDAPVGTRILN